MAVRLPARHLRVLLAVMRLTYGYGKDWAPISAGKIVQLTGIARRHVQEILKDLRAWKMLQRGAERSGQTAVLRFQMDSAYWNVGGFTDPVDGVTESTHLHHLRGQTCTNHGATTCTVDGAPSYKTTDNSKDSGANGSKNGNGIPDRALAAWLARGGDPRDKGIEPDQLAELRPYIDQALRDMAREAGRT